MAKLNEYITIKAAAQYLGVSQNTLRNWGHAGKIQERRHPVNCYRLYSVAELQALLVNAGKTAGPKKIQNRITK